VRLKYLDWLRSEGIISGYFEFTFQSSGWRHLLAKLMIWPGIRRILMRPHSRPVVAALRDIIQRNHISYCLCSIRSWLFAVPDLCGQVRMAIDWCDSFVLFHRREWSVPAKDRLGRSRLQILADLVRAVVTETYYSRFALANMVASSADKDMMDGINRHQPNFVLTNGVRLPEEAQSELPRVADRIIFTGNMNFPPNHQSAMWFIREVLPLLVKRRPAVEFVVAGANPLPELLAHNGINVRVTGFVADISREIAASSVYVAPMVSGGGFKNKIMEAMAVNTIVVATSMAVEFLDPETRNLLLVADTPQQMADLILTALEQPARFHNLSSQYSRIVRSQYSWDRRAEELMAAFAPHP